jgi:ribosome maturation protein Sdo1
MYRPKNVKIYQPELEIIPDIKPEVEAELTNSDSQVVTRMDEILAKIFEHGEASLTPEERAIMQEASRRLQKKNQ